MDCWRQFGSNYAAIGAPSIRRINAARLLPTGCGRSTQGACSSTTNPPTGVRHTQRPQRIVTTPPAANRGPVKIVVTLDQKKTFQLLGRIGLWVSRARHDRPARLPRLPVMLPDARGAASGASPAIPPKNEARLLRLWKTVAGRKGQLDLGHGDKEALRDLFQVTEGHKNLPVRDWISIEL